jgi:hypothetical protein
MYRRGQLTFSGSKATLNLPGLPKGSYILFLKAKKRR